MLCNVLCNIPTCFKLAKVTPLLLHFSSHFIDTDPLPPVKIGTSYITHSSEARNLGIIFDSHITLKTLIANVCRSGWAFIYMLQRIQKYLDERSTEKLMHAFITSRLDSCNSLLVGLPDNDVQKLQRLQNASARLVTRSKRNEHITPVLKHLHWLPVSCRIQYKLLLLVFQNTQSQCSRLFRGPDFSLCAQPPPPVLT